MLGSYTYKSDHLNNIWSWAMEAALLTKIAFKTSRINDRYFEDWISADNRLSRWTMVCIYEVVRTSFSLSSVKSWNVELGS